MENSPETKGDLGEFIIAELKKRGIPLSKTVDLSDLPATWRTIAVEMAGAPKDVGVGAVGCSWATVVDFLFSLFSRYRVHRPFSNDNDRQFWFTIDGKHGSFARTHTGLVISFLASGFSVIASDTEYGLFVGFADYSKK